MRSSSQGEMVSRGSKPTPDLRITIIQDAGFNKKRAKTDLLLK